MDRCPSQLPGDSTSESEDISRIATLNITALRINDTNNEEQQQKYDSHRTETMLQLTTTLYIDSEHVARQLEQTGNYRILRLLPTPHPNHRLPLDDEKIAVVLDVETTGLNLETDELIQLAMVKFIYNQNDNIRDTIDTFSEFNEPQTSVPEFITKLTGITNEMLKGKRINSDDVNKFIVDADLIIAHNATFDRSFCEKLSNAFSEKRWACSMSDVKWSDYGYENKKLKYLLLDQGWFYQSHRALDDAYAVLRILSNPLPNDQGIPFRNLLNSANRTTVLIKAIKFPFVHKDILKNRGYKWHENKQSDRKFWWKQVPEEEKDEELDFLKQKTFDYKDEPIIETVTALKRYKSW
ncbi:hypothetical protein I4U23_004656 [Adineta vaga]|nr:hypothetical protein I4U23_004656 [Adineta vaga]